MEVLNYQEQLSQRERERRGSIYLKCHDFKSINFRYHFKSKNFKGLKSLVDLSKFKSLTFLESVCYSFEKVFLESSFSLPYMDNFETERKRGSGISACLMA